MSSNADIEKPISLVRPVHAKVVQAILDRAHKQERSADRGLARSAQKMLRPSHSTGVLSETLGKAMAHHGRTKKGSVSLRPKATDTGGRSFHFSFSTVNKNSGASDGSGSGNSPRPTSGAGVSGSEATTNKTKHRQPEKDRTHVGLGSKEAGHQRYIERDAAVAKDADEVFGTPVGVERSAANGHEHAGGRETSKDVLEQDPGTREAEAEKKASSVEIDRASSTDGIEPAAKERRAQSAAAQRYVEDTDKVAPQTRHGHPNSFGTIGETFEARVAYWNDLHDHEREKDARTQIRLVLELPHETTPEARQEIVREFCRHYEELEVPYWASIHAPTKDNDDRNYHAHILHGNRPARRRLDPTTGKIAWDFAIKEVYTKKNRVKKTRHPFRQNVVPAFRKLDYIDDRRKRFADVVNQVLEKHGCEVCYDARSYKDMGLDVEPIKHVSRIVADKSKQHDFVVLDAAWTRRLIEQETNGAVVARDKTYMELKAVERKLAAVSNDVRHLRVANANLPKVMHLSPMSQLTVKYAKHITQQMIEIEYEKIRQRFVDEETAKTIQHVIDSTAPVSAHRAGKPRKVDPRAVKAAPSPEAMAILHIAAVEEMRLHRIAASTRMKQLVLKGQAALSRWQEQAQPAPMNQGAPQQPTPIANPMRAVTVPVQLGQAMTVSQPAKETDERMPTLSGAFPSVQQSRPAPRGQDAQEQARLTEQRMRSPQAPAFRPIQQYGFRSRPLTPLEVLEINSTTGQRYPAWMHDYVDARIAETQRMFEQARTVGPGASHAMLELIKANGIPGYGRLAPESDARPDGTPITQKSTLPQAGEQAPLQVRPVVAGEESPPNPGSAIAQGITAPVGQVAVGQKAASEPGAQEARASTTEQYGMNTDPPASRPPAMPEIQSNTRAAEPTPTAAVAAAEGRPLDAAPGARIRGAQPINPASSTAPPQVVETGPTNAQIEAALHARIGGSRPANNSTPPRILKPSDFCRIEDRYERTSASRRRRVSWASARRCKAGRCPNGPCGERPN